jgi:serine/threonine protein kinase
MIQPLINGRYQIIKELGRGSLTAVYHVQNLRFTQHGIRHAALKILEKTSQNGVDFRKLLQREAMIVARLEHPAIVSAHDFGQYLQKPYLVTKYCPGGSLQTRLQSGAHFPVADVCRIGVRLSSALQFMHKNGFVHRCINSEHVVFDNKDNACLTNFFNAYICSQPNDSIVTDLFVSAQATPPERWQGQPPSAQTDCYQLAVLMFEMLTGQQPFQAEKLEDYRELHLFQPVPAASSLNPALPPDADAVLQKALAKEPSDRFETAVAFITSLNNVLQS